MYKVRVTANQALGISAVGAVVARTNPNLPVQFDGGWILYTFDRGRRKWAYYLVTKEEGQAHALIGGAQ